MDGKRVEVAQEAEPVRALSMDMAGWSMRDWDDVIKLLFDSIRNITLCAIVMWAGRAVYEDPSQGPEPLRTIDGLILQLGGLCLLVLNLIYTCKKALSLGFSGRTVLILATLLYVPAMSIAAMSYKSRSQSDKKSEQGKVHTVPTDPAVR